MSAKGRARVLKLSVWILGLTPLAWVTYRAIWIDGLGANPIQAAEHWSGRSALTMLIAALAVTPIRRWTGFNDIQKVRRLVGLFGFAYLFLHFSLWLGVDQFFAWAYIGEDIAERPFILVGFTAFMLLVPMAITSTRGWIRRLGKNWVRLHRLIYVVLPLGVIHFFWATKADDRWPTVAAVVVAVLLAARARWALRARSVRRVTAAGAVLMLTGVVAGCVSSGAARGSPAVGGGVGPLASEAVPPEGLEEGVHFRVFRGDGAPSSLAAIVQEMSAAEVVLLGEEHDDAIGHRLQIELLERTLDTYLPTGRSPVLSLEMFESDVQEIVDEYLAGLITESHFRSSARPWETYEPFYRPLVEEAKARGLPVVAANAPRRYVNRASRLGLESLSELPASALSSLAPLPVPGPSAAYRRQWDALMGEAAQHMSGSALDGQVLWDATMAYRIASALDAHARALVMHVTGRFHMEHGTGVPEALEHYRPGTAVLLVAIVPVDEVSRFDQESHGGAGDFVILTGTGTRSIDGG